jgi:TraK protein
VNKTCFLLLSSGLLATFSLTAEAIFYEISTTQPLKCTFSSHHPNRIMMDKQEVIKVIHAEPEAIQILIEEKVGQAFVMTTEEIVDPVTLCVLTSDGEVQDLEVTFTEQPSQLVILTQKQQVKTVQPSLPVEECDMESTIQSILAKQVPAGSFIASFCTQPSYLKKKMKIKEVSRFDRDIEVIRVFEISNCAKQKQILSEKELSIPQASWIFLEKNTLQPKETIHAIICIKKVFQK